MPSWNFHRNANNHQYTFKDTEVNYLGNCENNLVISSEDIPKLNDVRNLFILLHNNHLKTIPISNFEDIKRKGNSVLFGEINYNIPLTIQKRERLLEHDLETIANILKDSYGIDVKSVEQINSGRTRFGKYFIQGKDRKKYVFKYKGKDKERVELASQVSLELESYFPFPIKRIDNSDFGVQLSDGFYGLEKFVIGEIPDERNLEYVKRVGKAIALLHNSLDNYFDFFSIKRMEEFGESTLLAIYLDLNKDKDSKTLVPYSEEVMDQNLSKRVQTSSKGIIHGDVNFSNVFQQKDSFVFVDSETLGVDSRLREFIPPLLFRGNMQHPRYLKGSLNFILDEYNKYVKNQLSSDEMSILPYLLKAAILKNHVVREIRRGNKTQDGIEKTLENLDDIGEDSNVY